MAGYRVNTHDAAELVSFLISTPRAQRVERWPVLLSLLTQWAASATATQPLPARPWERKNRHPATQSRPAGSNDDKDHLLEQALVSVQQGLHEAATSTLDEISQNEVTAAGAAALSKLFAPATLFIAAAVDAAQASLDPQLRTLAVAAVCQATNRLAAAPPATLWAAIRAQPQQGQQGLVGLLQSFKALVVACRDNQQEATWLIACLLSALQTAVPNVLQDMQHKLQRQCEATLAGPLSTTSLLQQQVQAVAASAVVSQLAELFSIGHAFGSSACKSALTLHVPTGIRNGSNGNALLTLQAVVSELEVACCEQAEVALLGLAASLAAGVCVGVLEALGPLTDAPSRAGPSTAVHGTQRQQHENLAAAAADVWGGYNHQHVAPAAQQHSSSSSRTPAAQHQQQQTSLRQQLVQQTSVLTAAVQAACSLALEAATGLQAADLDIMAAGTAAVGKGLLGQAYFRLCSTCGLLHASQGTMHLPSKQAIQSQQQMSFPGLQCALSYLTDHCCQLSGLFVLAGCCHDAPAANTWLSTQQLQHPAHEVGALARWLATAAASAVQCKQHTQLLTLLSAVKAAAVDFARDYSMYQAVTPKPVTSAVSAALLRQQLDSAFAMHVVILSDVWQACKVHVIPKHQPWTMDSSSSMPRNDAVEVLSSDTPSVAAAMPDSGGHGIEDVLPELVAVSLADLAALQFCRVQLPLYVELVRLLVTTLTARPAAADAFVAGVLPCYQQLIQRWRPATDAGGPGEAGRCLDGSQVEEACWLNDQVTVSQLSFLLPLLPLVVSNASSPTAAAQQVLPLLLLLLPHSVPGVSEAAHVAYAGLLAVAADPEQRLAHCMYPDALQQQASMQQQQPTVMDLMVQSVPLYLKRSLSELPGHGSFEGLRTSFFSLLKNLPPGSTMGLWAADKVASRAQQLTTAASAYAEATSHADPAPARPHSKIKGSRQPELPALAAVQVESAAVAESSAARHAAVPPAAAIPIDRPGLLMEAGAKLFGLLVLMIQLGDFQLLPTVLQTVAACVLASPMDAQQQWMKQLYTGCLATSDYTRKPDLMRWFNQLQAQVWQQGPAKVADTLNVQAPAAGL